MPSQEQIGDSYLLDLKGAIEELRQENDCDTRFSLQSPGVLFLLSILDQILSLGLKDQGIFQLTKTFFWDYVQNISDCVPGGQDIIEKVQQLKHIHSDFGYGRAFLCLSLNDKDLGTYLTALTFNNGITKKYYTPDSVIGNDSNCTLFLTMVELLSDFDFDIDVNNRQLDVAQLPERPLLSKEEIDAKVIQEQEKKERERQYAIEEERQVEENKKFWEEIGEKSNELVVEHKGKRKKRKIRSKKNKKIESISSNELSQSDSSVANSEEESVSEPRLENSMEEKIENMQEELPDEFTDIEEEKDINDEDSDEFSNKAYLTLVESQEIVSDAQQLIYDILKREIVAGSKPKSIKESLGRVSSGDLVGDILHIKLSPKRETTPLPKPVPVKMTRKPIENRFWSPKSSPLAPKTPEVNSPLKISVEEPKILASPIPYSDEDSVIESSENSIIDETPKEENPPTVLILRLSVKRNPGTHCFGCKSVFQGGFISGPRFCEYFGEFFCRTCHQNQDSVIPARIIYNWDFGRYKVSDKAIAELRAAIKKPVIPIPDILYQKSKRITRSKEIRTILKKMYPFISTCTSKEQLLKVCGDKNQHLFGRENVYSLHNLIDTKQDKFIPFLEKLRSTYKEHIHNCSTCYEKGTICKLCSSEKRIFPFDANTITCKKCKSVTHRECYSLSGSRCRQCS